MNAQTHVSELDSTKLANLRLRKQLLEQEAQRLGVEAQAFERELFATYGNPDEDFKIGSDRSITRTPAPKPVTTPAAVAPVAPKGKGARKPGGR